MVAPIGADFVVAADVDECEGAFSPCAEDAACTNLIGDYPKSRRAPAFAVRT